ncbi:MAG: hypothetical protein N2712_06430 [Brevinematales bacterium]|nr:hypothetical protein [Brevinematales bacterium]
MQDIEESLTNEILYINLKAKSEVLDNSNIIKNILPKPVNEEIVLALSLIKSGFVLPGLRVLYRIANIEYIKKSISNIIFTPKDIANIFFQTISLRNTKLQRFIENIGILPANISIGTIEAFDVRNIVINGITQDIKNTKVVLNSKTISINYYIKNGQLYVMINGIRFLLPKEIIEFIDENFFDIRLKSIFEFGLPNERVFFEVRKTLSEHETILNFDPNIKLSMLLSKIESENFIDFFYEFISNIATDFEMMNLPENKNLIIEKIKSNNMEWLLPETKNVLAYIYNEHPSSNLRTIIRNIEIFLEDCSIEMCLKEDKIRVITPLFEYDKYLGKSDYIKNATRDDIVLLNSGSEIKVMLKSSKVVIGKINNNTSRILAELNGEIENLRLIVSKYFSSVNDYIPHKLDYWLEFYILRKKL